MMQTADIVSVKWGDDKVANLCITNPNDELAFEAVLPSGTSTTGKTITGTVMPPSGNAGNIDSVTPSDTDGTVTGTINVSAKGTYYISEITVADAEDEDEDAGGASPADDAATSVTFKGSKSTTGNTLEHLTLLTKPSNSPDQTLDLSKVEAKFEVTFNEDIGLNIPAVMIGTKTATCAKKTGAAKVLECKFDKTGLKNEALDVKFTTPCTNNQVTLFKITLSGISDDTDYGSFVSLPKILLLTAALILF